MTMVGSSTAAKKPPATATNAVVEFDVRIQNFSRHHHIRRLPPSMPSCWGTAWLSHRNAAESLLFPKAMENNIPVLAFTTICWNQLQFDPPSTMLMMDGFCPTTLECLKFALYHPAVEVVLHSVLDEEELDKALLPLLSLSLAMSKQTSWLSEEECGQWYAYGSDEARWNKDDVFDEYLEESI